MESSSRILATVSYFDTRFSIQIKKTKLFDGSCLASEIIKWSRSFEGNGYCFIHKTTIEIIG